MKNYIFDIDGTLTPSRLPINENFELFFINWIKNKNVTNFPKIHDFLQDLGIIMHEV